MKCIDRLIKTETLLYKKLNLIGSIDSIHRFKTSIQAIENTSRVGEVELFMLGHIGFSQKTERSLALNLSTNQE